MSTQLKTKLNTSKINKNLFTEKGIFQHEVSIFIYFIFLIKNLESK